MRTDTEILRWLLPLFGSPNEEPTPELSAEQDAIMTRIEGAISTGLRGREMLEAAMQAILLEPGDPLPMRTGVQQIADEVERGDRSEWPEPGLGAPKIKQNLVQLGAACAVEIDELQAGMNAKPLTAREMSELDAASSDPVCARCKGDHHVSDCDE